MTMPTSSKKSKKTDPVQDIIDPVGDPVIDEDMMQELIEEWAAQFGDLEQQIQILTKKLTDQEEITKKAQSDYVRQKLEFDEYMTRSETQKASSKVDSLISTVWKILPVINQLKQMNETVPEDLTWNSWVEWVQLLYKKSLADIESLWIKAVETNVWDDVDYMMHIPIGMEEVEDDSLKNKIVKVIEPGYIYEKWSEKKIVSPAKVMVWS